MPRKSTKHAALGERLAIARRAAGFTTAALAAVRLGLPAESYERKEAGHHRGRPGELHRYAEDHLAEQAVELS